MSFTLGLSLEDAMGAQGSHNKLSSKITLSFGLRGPEVFVEWGLGRSVRRFGMGLASADSVVVGNALALVLFDSDRPMGFLGSL